MKVLWDDRFHPVSAKIFMELFGKPYVAPRFPGSCGFAPPFDFKCHRRFVALMTFMIQYIFYLILMVITSRCVMRGKCGVVSLNKYSLRREMCVSCTLPVIRSCTAHVAQIWFTIRKGPNLFGNSFPLGGPRRIPASGNKNKFSNANKKYNKNL